MVPKRKLSVSGELLRNLTFLTLGNVGNRAINFIIMLLLARRIGVTAFGQLNYAQTILSYFVLIADFGISLVGVRELADRRKDIFHYVGPYIGARLIMGLVATVTFFATLMVFPPALEDKLLAASFVYMIPGVTFSLDWVYRALERMEWIALSNVIRTFLPLGLIAMLIQDSQDLPLIPIVFAAGMIGQVVFYWFMFTRHYKWPAVQLKWSAIKPVLRGALSLGISYLMIQVYYNIDTLLLGIFRSNVEVGLYNAAYRIVLVFTTMAGLIGDAIFPRLSRIVKSRIGEPEQRSQIMSMGARILIYVALPIALGGMLFSRQIIALLYPPDYAPSSQVLAIIIWQVLTVFANASFAYSLLAAGQQRAYLYSVAAGASLNLILNLILIPHFGMVGASLTTMIAEVIVMLMLYYYASRLIAPVPMLLPLTKGIIAAGAFTLVAVNSSSLIGGLTLSTSAYLLVLLATSPFTKDEYRRMFPWDISR